MTSLFPANQLHADIVPLPRYAPRPSPTAMIRAWLSLGDTTWIKTLEREGTSPRLLMWLRRNWPADCAIPGRLLLAAQSAEHELLARGAA